MNQPQAENADATLDELLVAYLDGELDAQAARQVEARLAAEPAVRERLRRLEQPWDLLDQIDTHPVDADFTHTTLELVASAAVADARQLEQAKPRLATRRRWWMAAGLIGAAAAGFLLVALIQTHPDRQLAEDLPVLEHYETYRAVDDVEFLRELREAGLFTEGREK